MLSVLAAIGTVTFTATEAAIGVAGAAVLGAGIAIFAFGAGQAVKTVSEFSILSVIGIAAIVGAVVWIIKKIISVFSKR